MKPIGKIRRYIKISGFAPIGRRYFIMNAFDGATTILGIMVGTYVAEITNELWAIVWFMRNSSHELVRLRGSIHDQGS